VTTEERPRISDPVVMRALAHPARVAIMEHLGGVRAGATATECAQVVGLSPSATSYHLRALDRAGFVEEAPGRGDGRERLWRARLRSYSIDAGDSQDPETLAAEEAVIGVLLTREHKRALHWLRTQHSEPALWRRAALMADIMLLVTPQELQEVTEKMMALLEPYQRANREQDPPPGARRVSMQVRAVPVPEPAQLRPSSPE
jgi:DNA-binding transcriptional ArsR family regulator